MGGYRLKKMVYDHSCNKQKNKTMSEKKTQKEHDAFSGENIKNTKYGILASSIDMDLIPQHKKPEQVRDEIPTLNRCGYMKSKLEFFGETFIDLAKVSNKPALEVGCAYGWLTHQVLETDSEIVASDISKEHLEITLKDAPQDKLDNLYISKGSFPEEVSFDEESFDVVMASRIIHFLKGEDVRKGLDKIHSWLTPNGALICTNCSIYHSSVKEKMSKIFEERIKNKEEWAGLTKQESFDSAHDDYSHSFLNCFYKEQLEKLLPEHGFKIEEIRYFDYPGDPWPDEGKGHIGFVARKVAKN